VSGLDRVIAATLAGVGEGIAGLREAGSPMAMVACSIEVHVDEHGPPEARLVLDLRSAPPVSDGDG
jgi:hypothetical protein